MKLGSLSLKNNLLLAPLQNISTGPFRRFCRSFHEIGLVYVPMIYARRLISEPDDLKYYLGKIEEENPISIQLIGTDPLNFKKALDLLESYTFSAININAGCSSPRSLREGFGGALLRDLSMMEKILRIVVKHSKWPISLKTRIGYSKIIDIERFVSIINNSGLDFVTLHGRRVKDKYDQEKLDLSTIKTLKDRLTIPVVGNGDINTPEFAKYFLEYTNVDALMIGREAMSNPEIFTQIDEFLTQGTLIKYRNSLSKMKQYMERYERILEEYLRDLPLQYSQEKFQFAEMKRSAIWFTRNLKNSSNLRIKLSGAKTLAQLKIVLDEILF